MPSGRTRLQWPPVASEKLTVLGVGDGRSLNVLRWGRRLADLGHDVHLATTRMPDVREAGGITAHDLRERDRLARVPILRRARFGRAIASLAREIGADVVHAHYLLPWGFWAAQADVHPLVMSPWSREIFVDAEHGRGRRRAMAALTAADYLVTNSKANERVSATLGADPARMRQIVWYAELERFSPEGADPGLRARLGWPEDALVVLSLRNFRPYTNLDLVVRAFGRIVREESRLRLLMASRGGTTRDEIERLIDELGLRPLIAIERVEHADLPGVVAAADLVVTIADTDSTPASLLEAMASRLPVVAGRAPSIDEWVEQGDGAEVVACRDEDAVADAIRKLVFDPDLRRRYGERNERVVRERLAEPGPALEALYRELLDGAA